MDSPDGPGRQRRVLVTQRDLLLLELAAEHRLIHTGHAAALLGVSASTAATRLRDLAKGGYLLRQRVFAAQPSFYQITRSGLATVGSPLPTPRLDPRAYEHDAGLVWLWLAARAGTFGPMQKVLSERTLRSRDARRNADSRATGDPVTPPLAVRLGGSGPRGGERLHYPDLLLVTSEGKQIAVELELSSKGRARRERILAGYGSDPRFDAVLYLVDHVGLARSIQASARRLGISSHVQVQRVRRPAQAKSREAPAAERTSRRRLPTTAARLAKRERG